MNLVFVFLFSFYLYNCTFSKSDPEDLSQEALNRPFEKPDWRGFFVPHEPSKKIKDDLPTLERNHKLLAEKSLSFFKNGNFKKAKYWILSAIKEFQKKRVIIFNMHVFCCH